MTIPIILVFANCLDVSGSYLQLFAGIPVIVLVRTRAGMSHYRLAQDFRFLAEFPGQNSIAIESV